MSFLTAVLGGFGGYEKGRRERDDFQLRQQQAQSEAEVSQQQAEGLRLQNEATVRGQEFAKKMQLPPNWGSMDDRQRSAYLETSYWNAVHAGATDQATQLLGLISQGPLAYSRLGQGDVSNARVGLIEAQTRFENQLPQLQTKIAGMRDQTQLKIAANRLAADFSLAKINNKSRYDIAQLAAAYALAGRQDHDAVISALGVYQAQMRVYGIQLNPMNGLLEQAAGGSYTDPTQPQVPSIVQNFYGQGGGQQGGGGAGQGDNQGTGNQNTTPQHYDAAGLATLITQTVKQNPGLSKQQLSNNLEWMAKNGMASQGDVFNAIRKNNLPPPQ